MKSIFAPLFLLFLVSSCDLISPESDSSTDLSQINIKSGQSFGFCNGKCHAEMSIKGKDVEFIVKERNFENGVLENKEYIYNDVFTEQKLSEIEKLVDTEKFFKLEDVYGCPDCADGGSEWIEIIKSGDKSKKVTFEFGKSIPEIEKLINLLRKEREALHSKYVKQ